MNTSDALNLASYILGIANYNENLSQSDKDDMMKSLDEKARILLENIEQDLSVQNDMLKEIIQQNNEILERLR